MIASRTTHHGRRRTVRRQRHLVVAFCAAASLGFAIIAGLYVFGRTDPESPRPAPRLLADASRAVSASSSIPDWRSAADQRIAAARTPRIDRDADADAPASGDERIELPGTPSGTTEPPIETKSAGADSAADANNPRSLLRKARKQVRSGETHAALETSRQIAAIVGDDHKSAIDGKVRDAEAAMGAGQLVDFDSLIQLIEQVIAPTSWSSVGGAGTIQSFPGGVYVDTAGLMRHRARTAGSVELARVRESARAGKSNELTSGAGSLRMISLPRLEAQAAKLIASGQPIPEEMRYLAGLQEIRYVLVYPEEHDIVIAGPAEPWKTDEYGRTVAAGSGRPVLQLDDLVVILRACFSNSENHGLFGCGIYPRAERLQQVQQFLAHSAAAGPIEPTQRDQWLAELRDQLGEQDIEVFGIHPGSRVAQVLVEADYRMKLIGIGLQPAAVPGIPSYFDLLGQPNDAQLNAPIDTLRWWFMLNYDTVLTDEARDAFELRGSRAQVLSENEKLTATGQRVHTGQSDPVNAQFAKNFTDQFQALASRDANFADLAGIFDLAVLGGLLRGYELPRTASWTMDTFLDPDEWIVTLNPPPRAVETVINHRVYRGRHIKAVISGGVHVNPWTAVSQDRLLNDSSGALQRVRTESHSGPVLLETARWWWDQ